MGMINVLPFAVANLIAAGEVVDRPASVIKELMENAIDAGADQITVEIQNGGVTFMRVSDNGCGMAPEDLPIAIRRHATSKIRVAEDLDGINTLGFRGEALAAIAAVSDLRIISKEADAEFGAMLTSHSGNIESVQEHGCSTGTSIIVENLFSNVPARRKFLKKDVTESMAVTANVERVALSNPSIAFRLIIDGNVRLETAGDGDLKNTIYAVFGKEFASRLIPVESDQDGITVKGFIGRTDNFKANRNYQNFFINARYVKSKTAMAALEQAYTSYMPPEKFPACVLYLGINPSRVDVNVHPAKLEVKFSNEKAVFEAIYYTVRTALESNVTRPGMEFDFTAPKRSQKPFGSPRVSDMTIPVKEGPEESLAKRQMVYQFQGTTQPQPQQRMSAEEYRAQVLGEKPSQSNQANATLASAPPPVLPKATPAPPTNDASLTPIEMQSSPSLSSTEPFVGSPASDQSPVNPLAAQTAQSVSTTPMGSPISPKMPQNDAQTEQNATDTQIHTFPPYRIVGEVFHSYVIVETEDKMLLIDKHAAHERILFEQLKKGLREVVPNSQLLMLPIEVMLTAGEVEALREYEGELEKIGFSMRFARHTVSVDAIPEGVENRTVPDMLGSMAGRILSATGSVKLTRDIIFEKALYQAACKAAIKAGREYAEGHVEWIVKKLMELPDITFCPHGRPVALEMTHHMLDKQFDRTGF